MEKNSTTIRISKETVKRLQELGKMSDTYTTVIDDLIDHYYMNSNDDTNHISEKTMSI